MSVSVVASVESVSSAPMWRAPSAVAVSQGTAQTPTRTWNVSVRTEQNIKQKLKNQNSN